MNAREIFEEVMNKEWRWSPILVKIRIVEDENISTACIELDKLIIRINPKFWEEIDDDQRRFVIYHEILHMLFEHDTRGQGKNSSKWNIATDCEINSFLKLRNNMKLISGVIIPSMFGLPDNELAEFYYDKIPENKGSAPEEHFKGKLSDDARDTVRKIRGEILNEIRRKQSYGTSNTIEALISFVELKKITSERLRRELERFLVEKDEIDWMRQSRRVNAKGFYLPRNRDIERIEAIVGIDSSGSISHEDFRFFLEVLRGTLSKFRFFEVEIIQFDVNIKQCGIYNRIDKLSEIKRVFSGDTSFDKIIRYANKKGKKLIIFTDGDGRLREEIKVPVLWVLVRGDREGLSGRRVVIR